MWEAESYFGRPVSETAARAFSVGRLTDAGVLSPEPATHTAGRSSPRRQERGVHEWASQERAIAASSFRNGVLRQGV